MGSWGRQTLGQHLIHSFIQELPPTEVPILPHLETSCLLDGIQAPFITSLSKLLATSCQRDLSLPQSPRL